MRVVSITIFLVDGTFVPFVASSEEEADRIVEEAERCFEDEMESYIMVESHIDPSVYQFANESSTVH